MDLGDIELTLTPISGKSGKAYMGSYPDGKRVFIKMNTSPILPGLAREQIAPQLLWSRRFPDALKNNQYLRMVLGDLRENLPGFREDYATIVHGDVRHSNWFETESGLIYLVDWDSVRLTDRMFDVAYLLCHYIPEYQWQEWLANYGYKYNQTVLNKLYWYAQLSFLSLITKYYENQDLDNVNREIYALRSFREKYGKKK